MKRTPPKWAPLFFLPCFLFSLITGCQADTKARVRRMLTWEARDGGGELPQERIEKLKETLAFYREELDQKVKAGMEVGVYYRSLGLEYMTLEMYGLALDSFKEALLYFPVKHSLAYHAGVCAAQLAKAAVEPSLREEYLSLAEQYYLRSRQLDPGDGDVAYALAVLYYFEMNRPSEAEGLLESLLAEAPENHRAGLLLGSVQASQGRVDQAILSYEAVVEGSKDKELRDAAMRNRDILVGSNP